MNKFQIHYALDKALVMSSFLNNSVLTVSRPRIPLSTPNSNLGCSEVLRHAVNKQVYSSIKCYTSASICTLSTHPVQNNIFDRTISVRINRAVTITDKHYIKACLYCKLISELLEWRIQLLSMQGCPVNPVQEIKQKILFF